MFTSQVPWFELILRSAIIYLVVLTGLRLVGKRSIGQMSPFDLVLLLLLSNAVQNAMTGPDTSLPGGIIAASTLLGMNTLIVFVGRRNKAMEHLLEGRETMLIYQGKLLKDNMARENINIHELEQALREHGLATIGEVYLAVLEVDGAISIVKNDEAPHHHTSRRHFRYLNKKSG